MKRALLVLLFVACAKPEAPAPERPSILLVTLDTTRADSIGPDARGVRTPAFNALAARSRRFTQAYATAPQTLPSHASMLTGLYPAGHGVHENARYLGTQHALIAEKLREAGYRTAAFVSAFPLARRFGLARGFEVYDDELQNERGSRETTDRALAWLRQPQQGPVFLWVHYFDPHHPYVPSYRGEIEAMDAQLGRLVAEFEKLAGPRAIVVAGDHGEGLGEHGEAQHGYLIYQGVMHVPLLVHGPGVAAGVSAAPVSGRRVFHTILDFAGLGGENSLRGASTEVVLGEGMIPFLQFGWQPQIMAVEGRQKAIQAGATEVYDVVADPAESRDLGAGVLGRNARKALLEYPLPSPDAPPPADDEARRKLASLGYVAAEAKPVVRKDAPRPRDMASLFETLDRASVAFASGDYATALPLLEKIVAADPQNLVSILRIAAVHSAMGNHDRALAAFRQAQAIAPDSPDVRHYLALHYARTGEWQQATPLLERVVAESPDRLPAVEALAEARERQRRLPEALELWRRVHAARAATPAELVHVGELAMAVGDTGAALEAFEGARRAQGPAFRHDLELGVLYLAARIAKAREHADATTRELIANERLFR